MTDLQSVEAAVRAEGFNDFKWISGRDVQVRQWVRLKCMFGCESYGKLGTCPPSVPSIEECRQLFSEYERVLVIHLAVKFENPDDRHAWSKKRSKELLSVEREVFLSGYHKAFLVSFNSCGLCKDCTGNREDCKNKKSARPGVDALGVDVFETVRRAGFSIEVLKDYDQEMNRYALLLVE
jgi:predicted metal-binding protein